VRILIGTNFGMRIPYAASGRWGTKLFTGFQ